MSPIPELRLVALFVSAGVIAACGAPSSNASAGAVPTTTAQVIRTDIVSRLRLPGSLAYAGASTLINEAGPGVYTALPAPGAAIARGQALYQVNGRPIPLLYGDPGWRQLSVGAGDGADIKQLELNLIALGFATSSTLIANGHFDSFDALVVRRWQASLGVPQTGIVGLGDAVYAPGPIRVGALHPTLGMLAQPGQPVVDVTSPVHVVLVSLEVSHEGSVKVGDPVTVELPDGKTTAQGTVATIGAVAVAGSNGGPPAVPMTIALTDPTAGGSLDQAPVSVDITDAVHKGVLAVPVMALLAEPGGGYAVEVVTGSQRRTVTVTTGLFDDRGLVEVSGPSLSEGALVEVPQS
jgi:peptidoglycan hydrolase-like protein with peptidoglycan-binding domain